MRVNPGLERLEAVLGQFDWNSTAIRPDFQTIFSPFLGMAGHGRSWLSVAGQCQPLPKMAGHGWLATAGHGWLRLALVSAVGVKGCQWIINYSPHRV